VNIEQLNALVEKIKADPAGVPADELTAGRDAIRVIVDEAKAKDAADITEDEIAVLAAAKAAKTAIDGEITGREQAAAAQAAKAAELLADLDAEPEQAKADTDDAPADKGDGDTDEDPAPAAEKQDDTVTDETPELVSVAASLAAVTDALAKLSAKVDKTDEQTAPKGRSGRPGAHAVQRPTGPTSGVVTAKTYVGTDENGRPAENTYTVAQAVHERFRGAYQAPNFSGRMPVIHVESQYPEDRVLGSDAESNFTKIEKATSPAALTAAGGLCAPLETLYDVEVIGSAARPVRDSLAKFAVERGGITYRPNTSAASAVYGAGVWTLGDDSADPLGEKGCYVVDCPGLEEEVIEATYICLEFSNITARFDPETTAAHVQQAGIAHARLAENRLLAKMASKSKALSAPKVVGATRDILVNLDKASSYLRNRHRIDDALNLSMVLPGWVKSLMRADIARQMAAGDWMDALGVADSQIEGWFTRRNVSPVWHLDGPAGLDEVQTVTITGTPTGGTFTLTYDGQTTGAIAYNATAATVKSALAALSNIKAEDITVAGGPGPGTPYTVTFNGGATDGRNVSQMTTTGSLTGGSSPTVAVTTTTAGGGALTVNGISIASQTYDNATAGSVLPGFPDQIDALLYTTGSFLYLDGGALDLGLVRDSTLNSRNRYRIFEEEFHGAAFRGIESLRLAMTVQPTGQTAGTADMSAIAD
jgi:hypothetical protein